MNCDLCGKEVKKAYRVKIDETILDVCEECKAYADEVLGIVEEKEVKKPKMKKPIKEEIFEELEIVEEYGKLIKEKRMEMGLDITEFSRILNEKESVIKRIEEEKMIPNEELAKKIERLLGITLFRKVEKKFIDHGSKDVELTIGDVTELKS
ncbi:MAG: TIGR00270 family protein [Candidatus Aenigmarchaeota archaeon]|nr:TIGR00270 family protein [Candidatus Aenigmarchaeota archaeon]